MELLEGHTLKHLIAGGAGLVPAPAEGAGAVPAQGRPDKGRPYKSMCF